MIKEFRVDKKTLLRARVKKEFPFLKYDWFTRHYRVPPEITREVYLTFRRLSQAVQLVSIDELVVETELPTKVVISAIQQLCDSELSPVVIISTPLTEFIAGAELLELDISRLVKRVANTTKYAVIENPLEVIRRHGIDVENAPLYSSVEELLGDDDFSNIEL